MKQKLLLALCAFMSISIFTACDPNGFLDEILGNMTIVVSNPNDTVNIENDTIDFSSSIVDNTDIIDSNSINNIFIGANIELTQADVIINPYCGFQLKDTTISDYNITMPLDVDDFRNLCPETILTSASDANVFIVVLNDTTWYVGHSGQISITEYPTYGFLASGEINNVQAYYVTQSKIDYVTNLLERAENLDSDAILELQSLTLDSYFTSVTLNGTYESRRANIATLVQSLIDKFNDTGVL